MAKEAAKMKLADCIWIAVALLHKEMPMREGFTRAEIREKMREEDLMDGLKPSSVAAHLKEHLIANVAPSSTKYRMLFETTPGGPIRLFRPGDFTYATRREGRKLSKSVPNKEDLPSRYSSLLAWYESWTSNHEKPATPANLDDDPLLQLMGSGRHIWADEHADEYVENLRREDR